MWLRRAVSLAPRLGLFERIRLTPEGITLAELKHLTRTMLKAGKRLFSLSYHSPSLLPGNTPYVRTQGDLREFLTWVEAYIEFFLDEIGGTPSTPASILELARKTAVRG